MCRKEEYKEYEISIDFRIECFVLKTAGELIRSYGWWRVLETSHIFIVETECKLFRAIHLHLYRIRLCAWLPSFYWLNICPTIIFIGSHNSVDGSPVEPASSQVRVFCCCHTSSFQIRVVSNWTTKNQNCYSYSYFYFNYTHSYLSLQSAGRSLFSNKEIYFLFWMGERNKCYILHFFIII